MRLALFWLPALAEPSGRGRHSSAPILLPALTAAGLALCAITRQARRRASQTAQTPRRPFPANPAEAPPARLFLAFGPFCFRAQMVSLRHGGAPGDRGTFPHAIDAPAGREFRRRAQSSAVAEQASGWRRGHEGSIRYGLDSPRVEVARNPWHGKAVLLGSCTCKIVFICRTNATSSVNNQVLSRMLSRCYGPAVTNAMYRIASRRRLHTNVARW